MKYKRKKLYLEPIVKLSLFFKHTLHIGYYKIFTYPKLHKFVVGTYGKHEILNMIYSRRFLIFQVSPIIKYAYTAKTYFQNVHFLFTSINPALAEFIKHSAKLTGMDSRFDKWLAGSLTAKHQLKHIPDFVIIPDCKRSAMIVTEAFKACIPVIGLVNSQNKIVEKITYPIFGNEENYYTAEFFCNLCAVLILQEQKKLSSLLQHSNSEMVEQLLSTKILKTSLRKIMFWISQRFYRNKRWYKEWPRWWLQKSYFERNKKNLNAILGFCGFRKKCSKKRGIFWKWTRRGNVSLDKGRKSIWVPQWHNWWKQKLKINSTVMAQKIYKYIWRCRKKKSTNCFFVPYNYGSIRKKIYIKRYNKPFIKNNHRVKASQKGKKVYAKASKYMKN